MTIETVARPLLVAACLVALLSGSVAADHGTNPDAYVGPEWTHPVVIETLARGHELDDPLNLIDAQALAGAALDHLAEHPMDPPCQPFESFARVYWELVVSAVNAEDQALRNDYMKVAGVVRAGVAHFGKDCKG